jgi:hypothetical protein
MLNKIITLVQKFSYFHHSIQKGKTGNSQKLADQIGVSRRTLFDELTECRDLGIPIEHDSATGSYEFKGDVKFLFEITVDGEKIVQIKGGKRKFYNFLE